MPSENYFDDAPQTQVGDNAGDGRPEGSEQRGQEDEKDEGKYEHKALINSEICPDMKVGDVMELRILAVHDGEYEVGYNPAKGQEDEVAQVPEKEEADTPKSLMD